LHNGPKRGSWQENLKQDLRGGVYVIWPNRVTRVPDKCQPSQRLLHIMCIIILLIWNVLASQKLMQNTKCGLGRGDKKKKRKPGIVPETQRQWKVEELALRSTMKTERKTGSCSTNCSVSGFIHVCLSRFCFYFYFWISSLILVLILIFCLA